MQLYLPSVVGRLSCLLAFVALAFSSYSQDLDSKKVPTQFISPERLNAPNSSFKPKPVPVEGLYGQLLNYISFLDTRADALSAQGRDSKWMRNSIQGQLHFTDSEFAPLRSSAHRLTSSVSEIDRQAKAVRALGLSELNQQQLKGLGLQRKSVVNREVASLKKAMPADRRILLEAFMVRFFAPKKVAYHVPSATPRATMNGKEGAQ